MYDFFSRMVANAKAVRAQETSKETDILKRYEHDKYIVNLTLSSNDYGWTDIDEKVKVKLVNPGICAESPDFSTWNIMGQLKGTGHIEWEAILAEALMKAVCNWKKEGARADESADISALFNRDLTAKEMFFKKENIMKHLECIFKTEKVDENGTIYVRYNVA